MTSDGELERLGQLLQRLDQIDEMSTGELTDLKAMLDAEVRSDHRSVFDAMERERADQVNRIEQALRTYAGDASDDDGRVGTLQRLRARVDERLAAARAEVDSPTALEYPTVAVRSGIPNDPAIEERAFDPDAPAMGTPPRPSSTQDDVDRADEAIEAATREGRPPQAAPLAQPPISHPGAAGQAPPPVESFELPDERSWIAEEAPRVDPPWYVPASWTFRQWALTAVVVLFGAGALWIGFGRGDPSDDGGNGAGSADAPASEATVSGISPSTTDGGTASVGMPGQVRLAIASSTMLVPESQVKPGGRADVIVETRASFTVSLIDFARPGVGFDPPAHVVGEVVTADGTKTPFDLTTGEVRGREGSVRAITAEDWAQCCSASDGGPGTAVLLNFTFPGKAIPITVSITQVDLPSGMGLDPASQLPQSKTVGR